MVPDMNASYAGQELNNCLAVKTALNNHKKEKEMDKTDRIDKLEKGIRMLIEFIPEGWIMPLGWSQLAKQVENEVKVKSETASNSWKDRDLFNRFTYHILRVNQPKKYTAFISCSTSLAQKINDLCPDNREKDLARTKLEEAVMWAVKHVTG